MESTSPYLGFFEPRVGRANLEFGLLKRFSPAVSLLIMLLILPSSLLADAALRYKQEFKLGSGLPSSVAQQTSTSFHPGIAPSSVIEIKGQKRHSTTGMLGSVTDLDKQQITLIDTAHNQFSTVYIKDFADQLAASLPPIPGMPPQFQKMMQNMRTSSSSRKTGRTDVVLGIQVEESELTLSLDMQLPAGSAASTGSQEAKATTIVKMVMQVWTALPGEILRNPALNELASYGSEQASDSTLLNNPLANLRELLGNQPGLLQGFDSLAKELSKNKTVLLKEHIQIYMPLLAQLAQLMRAEGKPLEAGFDPSAPLAEMNVEAVDLSSQTIADSVFEPPADCTSVSLPVLLKAAIPAGRPSESASIPSPSGLPTPDVNQSNTLRGARDVSFNHELIDVSQLAWLKKYVGQQTHSALMDDAFRSLLDESVPDSIFHYGTDMPLKNALAMIFGGPSYPVQLRDERYLMLTARRSENGRGGGFLWIDLNQGLSFGGIFFYPSNGEPTPTLTIFSKQANASEVKESNLPEAFRKDLGDWRTEMGAPAVITRYFINTAGAKSVLLYDYDACISQKTNSFEARGVCEAMNGDAAETDMQAAYYQLRIRYAVGSAPRAEFESEQNQWLEKRAASCGSDAKGLACRSTLTRSRAQELNAQLRQR